MEKPRGAVVDMKLADCMTLNPQTIAPERAGQRKL